MDGFESTYPLLDHSGELQTGDLNKSCRVGLQRWFILKARLTTKPSRIPGRWHAVTSCMGAGIKQWL